MSFIYGSLRMRLEIIRRFFDEIHSFFLRSFSIDLQNNCLSSSYANRMQSFCKNDTCVRFGMKIAGVKMHFEYRQVRQRFLSYHFARKTKIY